jgi:lipopolysaccharide transport system ATP-binding protein
LGIIGPNGAGKSTMLKLLTRILKPTTGTIAVRGRVGALIEVAAGFHPDLTGRENVFLQGAIMGMRQREIAARLDEIVEFAGVGPFLDTPVKRYSSGMNARLGFSIAAHLDPDVLIIDEVLAVGDRAFQSRCVERMRAFKRDGVAIVFVSHNMQAVADLCERALYLKRATQAVGPTQDVIASYLTATAEQASVRGEAVDIEAAVLTDREGQPSSVVEPGAALRLTVSYVVHRPTDDYQFGFLLHRSTDGLLVYDATVHERDAGLRDLRSGDRFTLKFDFRAHLTRGQYHVECHVFDHIAGEYVVRLSPAATFTVRESSTARGIADVELMCSR